MFTKFTKRGVSHTVVTETNLSLGYEKAIGIPYCINNDMFPEACPYLLHQFHKETKINGIKITFHVNYGECEFTLDGKMTAIGGNHSGISRWLLIQFKAALALARSMNSGFWFYAYKEDGKEETREAIYNKIASACNVKARAYLVF